MPEVYDLYVTSPVMGVAQAIGSTKPMIVVDSGMATANSAPASSAR